MRNPVGRARAGRLAVLVAVLVVSSGTVALAQAKRGVMAMKPVVCRAVDEARGKAGGELAAAIEEQVLEMHSHGYALSALLAGEPPVACYRSTVDSSQLPRGAR